MLIASDLTENHFLFDDAGFCDAKNDVDDAVVLDLDAVAFTVHLKDGRSITVEDATSYQPEGPLTTFFSSGSTRQALDSWATRLASYRTADIVSIERSEAASIRRQPVLVAA